MRDGGSSGRRTVRRFARGATAGRKRATGRGKKKRNLPIKKPNVNGIYCSKHRTKKRKKSVWAAASWRCWAGVGGRPWAGLQARVKSPNRSTQLWRGLPFGRRRKELRPASRARLPRDLGSEVQGTEGAGDWRLRARVSATLPSRARGIGLPLAVTRCCPA